MMEVNPSYHGQMNIETMAANYKKLLHAAAEAPGVVAVGANYSLPFVEQMPWTRAQFTIEGQSFDEQKGNPVANLQNISPDYFRVMQIPLISGRFFDERDALGAPNVAIINRRLAERFWPGEDPIGRRLGPGRASGRRAGADSPARAEADGAGRRARAGRILCADAIDGNIVVRCAPDRSIDLYCDRCGVNLSRIAGRHRSGAACDESRSDGRAAG